MTSVSVQDYIQTIYRLQDSQSPVGTTALASQLGVSPASATGMIRKLHREGLVNHQPYHGATLTDAGEREALRLLRRHRLWELFLTEVLGLSWDQVHEEAHRLEHATSARVTERLAGILGQPDTDPHGQPIPARNGTLPERSCLALPDVESDTIVRIVEVPDSDSGLLRRLGDLGLFPGTQVQVIATAPPNGAVTIRVGESEHTLERELVKQLLVSLEIGEKAK